MEKKKERTRVKKDTDSIEIVSMLKKERVEFISSNSTLLNLALSGRGRNGGWARGRVCNIVGDGSSGKTLIALELAFSYYKNIKAIESSIFPQVKNFTIAYNNIEGVMDFPIEEMYGSDFVDTIQWTRSTVVEDFGKDFFRRAKLMKSGDSLLYIVDSWDALDSKSDWENFEKSIDSEKEPDGSMNMGKQKYASQRFFRKLIDTMEGKDITLFIVSQVKEKIGVTYGKKQYRAGGKALDYYTHQVVWLRQLEKITKTRLGQERTVGTKVACKVERNKTAKPYREAEFTVLFDYGVDDLNSNIDFLYGPKCKNYELSGKAFKNKEAFISYIETNDLEEEIQKEVEASWEKVENAVKTIRKPRF